MTDVGRSRLTLKRSIRSVRPCFDALSYLCEYSKKLLELSLSIWFSFSLYAIDPCILSRVHSIRTSFISPSLNLCNQKDLSQPLRTKDLSKSETRHDRSNLIT